MRLLLLSPGADRCSRSCASGSRCSWPAPRRRQSWAGRGGSRGSMSRLFRSPSRCSVAAVVVVSGRCTEGRVPQRQRAVPSPRAAGGAQRAADPSACVRAPVRATANVRLVVEGAELSFQAEVHAGALGAWPTPRTGRELGASIGDASTASSAEGQLARFADGFLHLRVRPGTISHRGRTLAAARQPHPPVRREAAARLGLGAGLAGRRDSRRRQRRRFGAAQPQARSGRVEGQRSVRRVDEPWLEVTRVLDIGVSWSVETIVRRVSPAGSPVAVRVPLLKGMLVTDSEHQVKDGDVLVTLGRDQVEARFTATLPAVEGSTVALKAPRGNRGRRSGWSAAGSSGNARPRPGAGEPSS